MDTKSAYLDNNSKENLPYIKKLFFRELQEHQRLFLMDRWKYLKGCTKILDAGCGRCAFMKANKSDNVKIFGVDRDRDLIAEAEKNGLNVKYVDLNKRFSFKDDFFDGVICSHVLEHFEDPTNLMNEFKRLLKDNGRLVLIVPNFSFKRFYDGYTHRRPYTKKTLRDILTDWGFENIRIENGINYNNIINVIFLMFPQIRFGLKKLIGKIFPSEFIAIATNNKNLKVTPA